MSDHNLSVPSDVQAVQYPIMDALVAFALYHDGDESFLEHKTGREADKTNLKASLRASGHKLSTACLRVQQLDMTRSIVEDLVGSVDDDEKTLTVLQK